MNIEAIREQFPITKRLINLDNASLSPLPDPVVSAVEGMLKQRAELGVKAFWDWLGIVDETKALIARLINATPDEIALTQNTSEGINTVANMLDWGEGDNVVLNNLEFFPNYWPWLRLRKFGVETRMVSHRKGTITTEDMAKCVDENTRVIALSSVAWINGLKHDLEGIGQLAHEHGAYLVVDGIQSVGASTVDVRKGPVDFLSCGGHKWLFSLLGSGFLFCRRELIEQFEPAYLGWQSDAQRFDYTFREYDLAPTAQRFMFGNTSIAGAHALHAGIGYINEIGLAEIEARNRWLTDYLIKQLSALDVSFLSPLEDQYRSSFINFVPSQPEKVQRVAEEAGILVTVREGGVRVSPHFYNTKEEINRFVEVVKSVEAGQEDYG